MEKLKQEKSKNILTKTRNLSPNGLGFLFYVGNTLLGLSMNDFWKITPAHFKTIHYASQIQQSGCIT